MFKLSSQTQDEVQKRLTGSKERWGKSDLPRSLRA